MRTPEQIALDVRRERIREAAIAEVADRTYAGATVGRIARRARVSREEIHAAFPGGLDEILGLVDPTAVSVELLAA